MGRGDLFLQGVMSSLNFSRSAFTLSISAFNSTCPCAKRAIFPSVAYKAIKRNQCEMALDMIKAYVPPMALGKQIETRNAQLRMEE